jgi:hypothetical protein
MTSLGLMNQETNTKRIALIVTSSAWKSFFRFATLFCPCCHSDPSMDR